MAYKRGDTDNSHRSDHVCGLSIATMKHDTCWMPPNDPKPSEPVEVRHGLRPAGDCDCGWIAQLYHDVWHETHAPLMPPQAAALRPLRFFIERTSTIVDQCVVAGDKSGFVAWQENRVGQLWLVPSARGTGLAEDLQSSALAQIKQAGYGSASLDCLAANGRGLRFYLKTGWQQSALLDLPVVPGSQLTVPFWRLTQTLVPAARHPLPAAGPADPPEAAATG